MSDWKTLDLLTPEDQTRARGLFQPDEIERIGDYEFADFGKKLLRRVRNEIVNARLKSADETIKAAGKGAMERLMKVTGAKADGKENLAKGPGVTKIGEVVLAPAAAPALAVVDGERIGRLALGKIVESAVNPRTNYNAAKLAELAASIGQPGVGIIQPLIVRALEYRIVDPSITNAWHIEFRASGADWKSLHKLSTAREEIVSRFLATKAEAEALIAELPAAEIVAGHRRYRAAGIAGIGDAPIIFRTLTDEQVLEMQLIENLQREDLDPIEEAVGLQQMLLLKDDKGVARYTVDSLRVRLGFESVQTIHDRLRLLRLPDAAKKAIQSALIGVAIGYLIAKVPNAAMRKRLTTEVLKGNGDDSVPAAARPMSWREVIDHIRRNYMKLLRQSETPFDLANAELVPAKMEGEERLFGGACTDCPHNSANSPEGGEQKFPFCTLVTCYLAKVDAHVSTERAKALAAGAVVVNAEAAREYLETDGTPKHGTGMVDINAKPLPGEVVGQAKAPVWREMLDGHTVSEPIVMGRDAEGEKVMGKAEGQVTVQRVVVFDEKGKVHHLAKRSEAITAATKNGFGHLFAGSSSAGKSEKEAGKKKRTGDEATKKKLASAIGAAAMGVLVEEIERGGLMGHDEWVAMVDVALLHSGADGLEFVCTRRNLGEGERAKVIRSYAKGLTAFHLQALVTEILLAGFVRLAGVAAEAFKGFATAYNLNLKAIAAQAKAAGKKPRGKPERPIRELISELALKRGMATHTAINNFSKQELKKTYEELQGPELTALLEAIKALPVPTKKKAAKVAGKGASK